MDISKVVPHKDSVIVKLVNIESINTGIIAPDMSGAETVAVRYGEVVHIGPLVGALEHCPGLAKGEIAVFTEFAGYYIPTDEDLYKAIRGYDIIGKFTNATMTNIKEEVIPTGDRLLVEILDFAKTEDGLYLKDDDHRLGALFFGKVIKVNLLINSLGLTEGQVVAFPPYVGTTIRHYESDDKPELRVIVENDILFTV